MVSKRVVFLGSLCFSVSSVAAVIWNKRRQHARRHAAVVRDIQQQIEKRGKSV